MNEFAPPDLQPRRGFTSIEAAAFLKQEVPHVPQWTCWTTQLDMVWPLRHVVGKGFQSSGTVGSWSWKRVPTSYPAPAYWTEDDREDLEDTDASLPYGVRAWRNEHGFGKGDCWTGLIEVQGVTGEQFLLFSYLDSKGGIGNSYFASTQDHHLLRRFAEDVHKHFLPKVPHKITIDVQGGPNVTLKAEELEHIILPQNVLKDIEQQTFTFFENKDAYKQMRLRHRRGFLFVGEPGTGKTMMIRHLMRQCHQRFSPSFLMLTIRRDTDEDDVNRLFTRAAKKAPSMVILEDLDSLTTQSKTSRSAFLSQLDGIGDREGLLVIATTNHPNEIDPALVHRPSRFDRVWHFSLPDYALRRQYLEFFLKDLAKDVVEKLARETKNWTFAYLKELYTTASIMAIERDQSRVSTEMVLGAFDLLDRQFQDGRKNHVVRSEEPTIGFAAA